MKLLKINSRFNKYTLPPVVFEDGQIVLKNFIPSRYSNIMSSYNLCDIDTFMSTIDKEELAKVTSMEYMRKFQEKLQSFENYYGDYIRGRTGSEYKFETKRNFDWKNGIYDVLKAYIHKEQGLEMRNSGVDRIFTRINNSKYRIRGLREQLLILEGYRKDCKRNIGKVVDNLDAIIQIYEIELETIKQNTIQANKMSPNYQIFNAINFEVADSQPPYNGFLNLKLFTIVIMQPNAMNIVKNNGDSIGELPTPFTYAIFKRPFSKILLGQNCKNNISHHVATQGGKHPYVSSNTFYDLTTREDEDDNLPRPNPWSRSLCLSDYTDDIYKPLAQNDYTSFVFGISAWNNIYNIERTNPHNQPANILYNTGLPSDLSDTQFQTFKSYLGFSHQSCWNSRLNDNRLVEDNHIIAMFNRYYENNVYEYGDYVMNKCDKLKCPLRNQCTSYQKYSIMINIEDIYEKIESLVGYIIEFKIWHNDYDNAYGPQAYYDELCKTFADIFSRLGDNVNYFPVIWNFMVDCEIPEESVPQEFTDASDEDMARAVLSWTQGINSQ
jgi:hypothetical protein